MKIESFTIKNYRSIKKLQMDNLNPVNVFFGKNNVGKSNILRGLHLAFYSLKDAKIFLPDTMFCNRNIYRPIEITVDLTLEEDFRDTGEVINALDEGIENIRSVVGEEELFMDILKEVDDFVGNSERFTPLEKLRLRVNLNYDEETSDIRVSIEDLESDYMFDYGKYTISYEELQQSTRERISDERRRTLRTVLSELSIRGVDTREIETYVRRTSPDIADLRRRIRNLVPSSQGSEVLAVLREHEARFPRRLVERLLRPFSETFGIVKEYFDKISDNFTLIPNKEYFSKGPFDTKGGEQIKIFDTDRFEGRLLSLIESPGKKDRQLIQQFNSVFSTSYRDLGAIEIRKFRERVFAIFDTGFVALPIENQGLGIQDLFLYLAHMILFDSAIIAIEEPEGGLSAENQRILHNIIEDVYSGSDKQIFISSHSEEFETPNSYIIELGTEGTKEISRIEKEKEYEEKIDGILIRRKLAEEKEQYEALLKEVTEREITLDILSHISKLRDEEEIDAQKISKELGYKKEKVEEIIKRIIEER